MVVFQVRDVDSGPTHGGTCVTGTCDSGGSPVRGSLCDGRGGRDSSVEQSAALGSAGPLVQAQLPGLAEGLDPVGLDGLSHHAALDTQTQPLVIITNTTRGAPESREQHTAPADS
ncbi:hypothetical protein EYF80_058203 [Liparis tanakae]|uniref:Uncharacterized protein n=1 Tax=Liparis tanakae TaxID=230148 RepID=A0A4Z2ES49_9TELE|nr:hypothetical protein EYF80_058203 [Liparis tanakae]